MTQERIELPTIRSGVESATFAPPGHMKVEQLVTRWIE